MKLLRTSLLSLCLCAVFVACASGPASQASTASEAPATTVLPVSQVDGTAGNKLADTLGSVAIVVDTDHSWKNVKALSGAQLEVVEHMGRQALKVTKNSRGEIRVAFLLEKPASMEGVSTLSYSVAGFSGWDGSYNCGLLYSDVQVSGERKGSFYVSRIAVEEWVDVEADLVKDEKWAKNFGTDKELYCIQFWSNSGKELFISDLALK